ncbi:MAG: ligase-associated DNA damage response endonuclease PdeM [Gemmatimonadaceae bacterium]|jgi:DNA ligase-associated metallophosphoesterase|nr:ligase-associated DNA damage response endonuclease PdeM [Gemmatimonadaceae bacterium]
MNGMDVTIGITPAVLLADRALWLPTHGALVVADVHLGKSATFRAHHIPVPGGTTASDLARLDALLAHTGATSLVVLGDLLHARAGVNAALVAQLEAWRATHAALEIVLVRGNHDAHAGDPPASLRIACVDAPAPLGEFRLHHHPCTDDEGIVLAGHLHPAVALRGRGRQKVTLPCFAVREGLVLLPAFGGFTGAAVLDAAEWSAFYAIAEGEVVAIR